MLLSRLDSLRGSSVKIGTIQRILAWPLRKDDTHKSRSVNMYMYVFVDMIIVEFDINIIIITTITKSTITTITIITTITTISSTTVIITIHS